MPDDRDWNRPRAPQGFGRRFDRNDDHDRHSGGYFQGQRGEGNNPGRFPIDPSRDLPVDPSRDLPVDPSRDLPVDPFRDRRQDDPWRGHADPGAEYRARTQARGWRRDDDYPASGRDWPHERDIGRGMGHGLGRNRDEHLHGYSGRGYGGLSNRDYDERGPGRVFDRGEDYGRADTHARGRAGDRSRDPGAADRRDRGFIDRAADEVVSWFGDDEAERRRRMDEREGRYRTEPHGRSRRDW
jgi:hypothetical protein